MPRLVFGLLLSFLSLVPGAFSAEPAAWPHGDAGAGPSVPAAAPEPPAAPAVLAPADGASLHGAGARFSWLPSAGLRYRLQVARDAQFADLVIDRDGFEGGQAIVALPPGEYHWRLRGLLPSGGATADAARYADARRFTLRPVPPSPVPEPPRLEAGALVLRWQAGQPGEAFEAELARDPRFTDLVARHAGPGPQLVLPDPPGGTLYLRLRTIDVTGYAGPYGPAHAVDVPRSLWWRLLPPLSVLWWLLLL